MLGYPSTAVVASLVFAAGCSSTASQAAASTDTACAAGQPLAGVAYDVSKSRFAFGGTPVKTVSGDITHWTGPDGELGTFSNGETLAILDATAPENDIAPLSGTDAMLAAYVQQYFEAMGVPACQIANAQVIGSTESGSGMAGSDAATTIVSEGSTLGLRRSIAGIPIGDSLANAQFDVDYQTTSESFYWPEIPANVVTAAIALNQSISTPSGLAAYKAKLPSDAQGDGVVQIHHTSGSLPTMKFIAVATYDVSTTGVVDGFDDNQQLSFDADGTPVTLPE